MKERKNYVDIIIYFFLGDSSSTVAHAPYAPTLETINSTASTVPHYLSYPFRKGTLYVAWKLKNVFFLFFLQ